VGADCPVILAGGGVHISDAVNEVRELADLLTMPLVTTFSGRGAIEDSHALALGLVGNIGADSAKQAVEAADVLLLVGYKSGQNSTLSWKLPRPGQKLIHLDIDPAEIGKVFPTEVGLVGDAKLGLQSLLTALKKVLQQASVESGVREKRLESVRSWRAAWERDSGRALTSDQVPIKPQRVMQELIS
jgi:acetolactate synthase-1/2/3 large subunit